MPSGSDEERIADLIASNRALWAWARDEQRERERCEEQRTEERAKYRALEQATEALLPHVRARYADLLLRRDPAMVAVLEALAAWERATEGGA